MARVLMLTSTLPRSTTDTSIASFVFDLAQELSNRHNYSIRILAPHIPGTPTYEVWDGIEIVRFRYFVPGFETLAQGGIMTKVKKNPLYVGMAAFFMTAFILYGWWQMIRYRPQLIHAHWLFPGGFVAWMITTFSRTPYITTSHGSDTNQLTTKQSKEKSTKYPLHSYVMKFFSPIFQFVQGLCIHKAQRLTFVSDDLRDKVRNLDISKSEVIPMGIRDVFFVQPNQERQHRLVSVGRLDWDKGFQDGIEALVHLPNDIQYTIVGEGNARKDLEALAQDRGVSERVHLVGSKSAEEIKALCDQSALFLHPSRHEGVGLVVLEAMASGIPVITSDIPALRQHTQRGGGISINTQDTDLLAKTIQAALLQVDTQSIQKAQEYAKTFEWKKVGKSFHEIYQECL